MPSWLVYWNHWNLHKRTDKVKSCDFWDQMVRAWPRSYMASEISSSLSAACGAGCSFEMMSHVIFIPKAFGGHCRGLWWKEEGGLHGNSEFMNIIINIHDITVQAPNRFHVRADSCEDQPKDEFLRLKQRVWTLKIWGWCRRWQIIAKHSSGLKRSHFYTMLLYIIYL